MASLRWRRDALGVVVDLPQRWRQRLVVQTAHLRRFPELGGPVSEIPYAERRLIVGPYSVLYSYDAETDVVSIVSVARGGPLFR